MTARPDRRRPDVFISEPNRPGFCIGCGWFAADNGRHREDCTDPHREEPHQEGTT